MSLFSYDSSLENLGITWIERGSLIVFLPVNVPKYAGVANRETSCLITFSLYSKSVYRGVQQIRTMKIAEKPVRITRAM